MLSCKNLGIILLISLVFLFLPIPFIDEKFIAAIIILVVAILLIIKGK